ncbi:hypothetical protein BDW67DRAFT_177652 [Aspergillus spinulosporus]
MINVLLQVQSLISPFVAFPSFHLLSIGESDTVTSTIETAKEELRSAKQALPAKQRLFLHLLSKITVNTACIPNGVAWYDNNANGYGRNGERPPAAQSLTRRFASGGHHRVDARLVEDFIASLVCVFVCGHNSYRHRSFSKKRMYITFIIVPCSIALVCFSCYAAFNRREDDEVKATDKQTEPPRGRIMPAVYRHNSWNINGTTFRSGLIRTFSVDRTLSRRDYTVGLICALHIEFAAVLGMLDEIHADLPVPRIRQGEDDQLFQADYGHSSPKGSCNNCNKRFVIPGPQRGTKSPQIYYGPIASVARVVKDAELRDRLAAKLGNLCFEMEAAGLVNNFPCLIIRGISDYADSQKNNHWHRYAAATAAAYAKELLSVIAQEEVEKERVIS